MTLKPSFVPGVWGPYNSAILSGLYLNEGGQSVTGKLIDFIIQKHPAFPTLKKLSEEKLVKTKKNLHKDLLEHHNILICI